MRRAARVTAGLCCAALLAGCRRREPPEVARARANALFLEQQIQGLEALVAKAESGGLETEGQIAIAVSETLVKGMLDAALPREVDLGKRLKLRLESAQAFFRGTRGGLGLRARISSSDAPGAYARVELAGSLEDFELRDGKLVARVALLHFSVMEASVGDLAADVLEGLVKQHLDTIQGVLPRLVVPVSLEESVKIDGLADGVVTAKAGMLPLAIKVAQVIPSNGRLWILLDAKAGPWQALPAAEKP